MAVMDKVEVIAVLVGGDDGGALATVILRDAQGNVESRQVAADHELVRRGSRNGCFRRGDPIVDPVSREILGYELEEVAPGR